LAYLTSYLLGKEIKNDAEIKIKNIPLKKFLETKFVAYFNENLINCIKEFKPDVIGLSCYLWNFKQSLDLCKEAKKINFFTG